MELPSNRFSAVTILPGVEGNYFDIVSRKLNHIEKLPAPLFFILLLLLAILPGELNPVKTLTLLAFYLFDWLLLASLPVMRLSYGPPQPPTLLLAGLRCVFAFLPAPFWYILQSIGTFLVIWGFYIEPHRLHITHRSYKTRKLSKTSALKIVHLADLHVEYITRREKTLQATLDQIKPDLILFSGDILNLSYIENRPSWQAARKVISNWKAPAGVFLVSGSPAVDKPETTSHILNGLNVTLLQDQTVSITVNNAELNLVGLTCTHQPYRDALRLQQLISPLDKSKPNILLYHSPDLAPDAALFGVDLMLCGHTHGGQVRLPFFGSIFTGSLYGRRFQAGEMRIKDMLLYISRGIGLEGAGAPRVRFLCPPEIIVWELSSPDD